MAVPEGGAGHPARAAIPRPSPGPSQRSQAAADAAVDARPQSGRRSDGAAAMPAPISAMPPMPPPMSFDDGADVLPSRKTRTLKFLKTLLIAASVAIIVVGVAQTAMEMLFSDEQTSAPDTLPPKDQSQSPAISGPRGQAPSTTPSRPMPTPDGGSSMAPPSADPEQTNSVGGNSMDGKSFFDPSTAIKLPDVTGSIGRKPAPPKTPAQTAPSSASHVDALPASISPASAHGRGGQRSGRRIRARRPLCRGPRRSAKCAGGRPLVRARPPVPASRPRSSASPASTKRATA